MQTAGVRQNRAHQQYAGRGARRYRSAVFRAAGRSFWRSSRGAQALLTDRSSSRRAGQQHLNNFYFGTNDLLNGRFDALIMTGTEPQQPNLRNEPYWPALADVLDWAESNTASTILSCLAAHAGVLHSDGIERHPLADKQFGVFDFARVGYHELTDSAAAASAFSSFSMERGAGGCTDCEWLSGTDAIVRGRRGLVHKEEKAEPVRAFPRPSGVWCATLLREYRRDVKRFLKARTGNVSLDAEGLFRCAGYKVVDRF